MGVRVTGKIPAAVGVPGESSGTNVDIIRYEYILEVLWLTKSARGWVVARR